MNKIKRGSFCMILLVMYAVSSVAQTSSSQSKLAAVPDNIKAVEQADSPVQVTIDGLFPNGTIRVFRYTVRNAGIKEIKSIVMLNDRGGPVAFQVLGIPSALYDQLGYESGLVGGASKSFSHPVETLDRKSNSSLLSVDFVLFADGTTWGPDKQGQGQFLLGIFDGHKKLLAETKVFVAAKDDSGLRSLLTREPMLPDMGDLSKGTRRQDGFRRGYFAARLAMQADIEARGDLTGIPARIRDLERELGLIPFVDDKLKQISLRNMFKQPIKVNGFAVGGKNFAIDERFAESGDWLTSLRLKVRNISGKTITHVTYTMHFPETVQTEQSLVASMRYGPIPFRQLAATSYDTQPLIAPDENFEINLDEKDATNLKKTLDKKLGLDQVSRVVLEISYIHFDDGTRWAGGQFSKPDPEDPKRWITIP